MKLSAYFDRIGYAGPARTDIATLTALHRAHTEAIPFENLDVQLGRRIEITPEAIFDKLVTHRRGGWCYEQNGLLGWALRQIGFDVTRLAGGVMRESLGDTQIGNHLCLLVRLDQPYLADVGFGGSLSAPLPLRAITRNDAPFDVALADIGDGYWRFTEGRAGMSEGLFSFDFRADVADEALLLRTCTMLQTATDSNFVLNLVVQLRRGETHRTLRGRVFSHAGGDRRLLASAEELVTTLREEFRLDVPEAATLWPTLFARHAALFPED